MNYFKTSILAAILPLLFSCGQAPETTWINPIDHSLWRGERAGAVVMVQDSLEISGLRASVKGIPFAEVHPLTYVTGDVLGEGFRQCGWRKNKKEWDSIRVADRICNDKVVTPVAGEPQKFWLSVKVPADCKPGHYDGSVKISGKGMKTVRVPFSIEVADRTLPPAKDWEFHLDLWQNPYSVARYHNVEPWSEEHFKYLKTEMQPLADAGQKVITATILDRPWNGQTEDAFGSMVVKTLDADGNWAYDYSIFDRWVEFMMSLGIDKQISCFTMIPWKLTFDYVDAASGETKFITAAADSPEYRDYWQPFLKDFAAHLKQKGWFEKTCIAMDERPMEAMQACLEVIHGAVPDFKVSLAGSYHEEIADQIYDLCVGLLHPYEDEIINERRAKGMVSTYYTCCSERYPNTFMVSNPMEACWLGWMALYGNYDGYLRWAFNSWTKDPVNDARFIHWPAGDCYMVYPDGCSSVRFERVVEGFQDYEKASILRKEWEAAGESDKLRQLEEAINLFTVPRLGEEGPEHALSVARKALEL